MDGNPEAGQGIIDAPPADDGGREEGHLDGPPNFKPDASDIQVPSASLPEQTADPDAVETKKPDVPDDLPSPGGDGADEEVGTKKAELPESMAA